MKKLRILFVLSIFLISFGSASYAKAASIPGGIAIDTHVVQPKAFAESALVIIAASMLLGMCLGN